VRPHGIKITPKRLPVSATVDEVVVKRLEMLGIDIKELIKATLTEAAGHYVCPTCGSLLRPKRKV
jgi:hypothetical protein